MWAVKRLMVVRRLNGGDGPTVDGNISAGEWWVQRQGEVDRKRGNCRLVMGQRLQSGDRALAIWQWGGDGGR